MARVPIAIQKLPTQGAIVDLTAGATAGDAVNHHSMVNDGETEIEIFNGGVGVATATIISTPDPTFGRTQNLVVAVPAGKPARISPLKPGGWNQSDGTVHIDLDVDTSVTLSGVRRSNAS
jgi:hypothetical protein